MQITPEYLEAAQRLEKDRPSYGAKVHTAHVESLGLSGAGQDAVVRGGPHVAHFLSANQRELNKIRALAGREQGPAIDRLASGMERETTNEDTDRYIAERTGRGLGTGGRYVEDGR